MAKYTQHEVIFKDADSAIEFAQFTNDFTIYEVEYDGNVTVTMWHGLEQDGDSEETLKGLIEYADRYKKVAKQ